MAKLHVVIARFRESLSWVPRVLGSSQDPRVCLTVYDKSGNEYSEACVCIPNVGREAETFARFIVDNYEGWQRTPPRAIMFLQGHPFDHVSEDTVRKAAQSSTPADVLSLGRIVSCEGEGWPDHPGLPVRKSHALLFGGCELKSWEFCAGAQYIVPPYAILDRPLDFWTRLHELLASETIDPWSMERLWPHAFIRREKI